MDGANVPSSFQDGNLLGAFPDTLCLANFRLSLPGRFFLPRHFLMLVRKSFSSRAKARAKAAWFFQFEKAGS
jgi:hypothetical protein